MGVIRIPVPLDSHVVKRVDQLVHRGRFATRGQAIAAVVSEAFQHSGRPLTVADVEAIARRGRAEFRAGKARIIESSADLK